MSSNSICEINNPWHQFMEPSRSRTMRKLLQEVSQTSQQSDTFSTRQKCFGLGVAICLTSLFDTISYGGNFLREASVAVVHFDWQGLRAAVTNEGKDLGSSLKYLIVFTAFVFAGIFFPKVYSALKYPLVAQGNSEVAQQMQNLRQEAERNRECARNLATLNEGLLNLNSQNLSPAERQQFEQIQIAATMLKDENQRLRDLNELERAQKVQQYDHLSSQIQKMEDRWQEAVKVIGQDKAKEILEKCP